MNKKEAIQAMLDGRKVKNDVWTSCSNKYIFFDGHRFLYENKSRTNINFAPAEDWEIYTEPLVPKFKAKDWVKLIDKYARIISVGEYKNGTYLYKIDDGREQASVHAEEKCLQTVTD